MIRCTKYDEDDEDEVSTLPFPSPQVSSAALNEVCIGLAPDLPFLMFGSGDAAPQHVDDESVSMLAELTASYISDLVDAAVDAHDILTDGKGVVPQSYQARKRRRGREGGGDSSKQRRTIKAADNNEEDSTELAAGAVIGVDLGTYHARPKVSTALGTQCFIFPICHDTALYGRVRDIQSAKRQLEPLMLDPVMMDMVKEEAGDGAEFPARAFLPVHHS